MMMGGFLANLGSKLDRMGFRPLVAVMASAAYGLRTGGRQRFFADRAGHWVNHHSEATIVSPTIHTARFGAYRELVMDNWAWQYQPRPGDAVVDVGAGVGEEAVVFSKLVGPGGKIFSIEAHAATFACLEGTVERSRLENVVPIMCAVTDRDGIVSIDSPDNHLASSVLTGKGGQSVPSRSLDSLATEFGLGPVALLKMNIEGAERLAVQGMTELSRRTRHVVISCHDFISEAGGGDQFRTFDEVRQRLEGLGFELSFRPDHPQPWVRFYIYGRNRAFG